MYFRNNPTVPSKIRIGDEKTLIESSIEYGSPTIIFFHGFLESSRTPDGISIKDGKLFSIT